ncbi:hypothetical protein MGG_17645 [Pyricularia oryzae 70-15]|uniref:Uncharacterized protein n=1 Tax=Pyricularia oryzae (strain 70-15 / ATCC MYA-4617 / FGSC 8958) TaxID=242507 RepID=G4NGJ8_PYRO7|nr:uncharacterized protein MGG_17645 [Pyricularia oryzae 70-15]EHA47157.1 hypothetical protein MGG_17645 [Pyricularia oryzae 70-15]
MALNHCAIPPCKLGNIGDRIVDGLKRRLISVANLVQTLSFLDEPQHGAFLGLWSPKRAATTNSATWICDGSSSPASRASDPPGQGQDNDQGAQGMGLTGKENQTYTCWWLVRTVPGHNLFSMRGELPAVPRIRKIGGFFLPKMQWVEVHFAHQQRRLYGWL